MLSSKPWGAGSRTSGWPSSPRSGWLSSTTVQAGPRGQPARQGPAWPPSPTVVYLGAGASAQMFFMADSSVVIHSDSQLFSGGVGAWFANGNDIILRWTNVFATWRVTLFGAAAYYRRSGVSEVRGGGDGGFGPSPGGSGAVVTPPGQGPNRSHWRRRFPQDPSVVIDNPALIGQTLPDGRIILPSASSGRTPSRGMCTTNASLS